MRSREITSTRTDNIKEISDKLARNAAQGRWNKTTASVNSAKELQTKQSVMQAKAEIEKAKRHKELQAQRTARNSAEESVDGGSPEAAKRGVGNASYVSQNPKEFGEAMLPKSMFAGSKKNKLGPAGQLKGNMKRPARAGDLVGCEEAIEHNPENPEDPMIVGHQGVNPARLSYRIKQAKWMLAELAKKAQTAGPNEWKIISHHMKELEMNIEQIRHAYEEMGKKYFGESELHEDWQKVNKHDKTAGMSKKAVKAYRRENPGSKLKTAVTKKPSELKKGSKDAKRRKSFCARMSGMKKSRASAKTKRDPNSPINKALRRWNCESIEEMRDMIVYATTEIIALKEEKQRLDAKCWKGYKKSGTKMKGNTRVNNCVKVGEGKSANNFTPDDIKELESIRDLSMLKQRAFELISRPSRKPMTPEKVQWFKSKIDSLQRPAQVIELMYDLLLSGEGNAVIGDRYSTKKNNYRQQFGESKQVILDESWEDQISNLIKNLESK